MFSNPEVSSVLGIEQVSYFLIVDLKKIGWLVGNKNEIGYIYKPRYKRPPQ
jgi:hypothetical protein